ncbi:MAG: RNA polymerase-binding protein DksA [Desulfobacterales bacterium]|nr:RNA polymerase-binding protein DksA [Desulfobacterales bacterium]
MEEKELEFFKGLLNNQMKELLNQAGCSVADMSEEAGTCCDPLDRASLEIDRTFTLRIRDRESRLIKKIKKALERIKDGTFCICERCGEKISMKRLKARPVATLCIECKTNEESIEKVIGT